MEKLRSIFAFILVFAALLSLTSCYIISAQPMKKVAGTYKLTTYTYTPTYERKEGVTPTTYDYVNDEKYKYEDYLVITGNGNGYYVHKDASGDKYVKEITLRYEYNQENSSKVEYVIFNDSVSNNSDEGGRHRLGVINGGLNYSKSGFDFTQAFTKKQMHSESITVKWKKVDKATDLSYVNGLISDLKYYSYEAFARRGIYEINTVTDTSTNEVIANDKRYFVVIDTANGVTTAKGYSFSAVDTPATITNLTFSANADFSVMNVGGDEWTVNASLGGNYYDFTSDGFIFGMRLASSDITEGGIEYYIANYILPSFAA